MDYLCHSSPGQASAPSDCCARVALAGRPPTRTISGGSGPRAGWRLSTPGRAPRTASPTARARQAWTSSASRAIAPSDCCARFALAGLKDGQTWAPAEADTCIRTADCCAPGGEPGNSGSAGCWAWFPNTTGSVKRPPRDPGSRSRVQTDLLTMAFLYEGPPDAGPRVWTTARRSRAMPRSSTPTVRALPGRLSGLSVP
jgi:hypothetical protein